MGKQLRPVRVPKAVSQMLERGAWNKAWKQPPWIQVTKAIPPAQTWIRSRQPVQGNGLKASKNAFKPVRIQYPEDSLRQEFFEDHPWELARPRVVLENDGNDAKHDSWDRLAQPHRATNGESVVQRQAWLMHNVSGMTKARAYDQARREFYEIRHQEDIERNIAREEALAVGAYFAMSPNDAGMVVEDAQYEEWKVWADKTALAESARTSGSGPGA